MKKTCKRCFHWQQKTDETGVCALSGERLYQAYDQDVILDFLESNGNNLTDAQRKNMAIDLANPIRTTHDFGCNQFYKK